MLACSITSKPDMMRALISVGANVNVKGKDGVPLLVKAAMMNQLEAVEVLIFAKADVNARDKDGHSALDVVMTLPLLATAAGSAENRALTSEEKQTQERAERIAQLLKQAGAK